MFFLIQVTVVTVLFELHNEVAFAGVVENTIRSGKECSKDEFQCPLSGDCIPNDWVCDGINACDDGRDEQGCTSSDVQCDHDESKCLSVEQCIMSGWLCDGDVDCNDGSDEVGCPETHCEGNQILCTGTDRCIPEAFKCDGDWDCAEGTDEASCYRGGVPFRQKLIEKLLSHKSEN